MPNHILNVISIDSDDKQQREQGILSILDNQGVFDFNRFIPMPRILRNTQAPNRINPDECRNKTGYIDWYEWSWDNWDTKWNAYNQNIEYDGLDAKPWHLSCKPKNIICNSKYRAYLKRQNKKRFKASIIENGTPEHVKFYSAWGHPEKVIIAMSKKHPDFYFRVKFADEDLGRNLGEYVIKNGELFDVRLDIHFEHKEEAFAEKLWNEYD
ncbi:hypothetical protein ACPV30_18125 [Photobacterium damselae]|uniref:DUF1281 family ferredoxin-like fold protein n=1 Tax=Photobacterium damselae TaxID=38293 RepID=UPI0040698031